METRGLIILVSWAGLTAMSLFSLWLGEFFYAMILVFGAFFITFAVGFGMSGEGSPEGIEEVFGEISKLRGEVEALRERVEEIGKKLE